MSTKILEEVFEVIKDRKQNPREDSYVSALLKHGEEKILGKIREESLELLEASEQGSEKEIIHESADVIFHVMVMLASKDIDFEEVMEELRGRRKPRESE
ncbi:phosphoribosyl-ATP pyrophosphatase [candidate division MSBL1 archaeon SCGC-AAA382A13]|uniref:Phosphoribosyl-ATP pyrophosphatase n=2 Tax=candidate division MSBL1 TaxID=215777 RepID=A0A133VGZ1_9EURY|nr:phosphoribosyl-ATP pyrophosphatase [candidate division MSBL1 archaeon SCGC-AAA382A13]KXB05706.1 phosphoribosyl-ATP pyrophosphatase [candidate division MSBL1 archaeon SCGC-AAA382A03]